MNPLDPDELEAGTRLGLDAARRGDSRHELELRLADAQAMASAAHPDRNGNLPAGTAGALLAAIDYALRGQPGCVEPGQWDGEREAALKQYRGYLDLPGA
jgi:hypothetical protein